MRNIFVIIILTLFLISCGEESKKPDVKIEESTQKAIASESKIEEAPLQTIEPEKIEPVEDKAEEAHPAPNNSEEEHSDKWDKIVSPDQEDLVAKDDSIDQQSAFPQQTEEPTNGKIDLAVDEQKAIPSPTFNISDMDIVLGDTKSKIIFVEYFSPTCPHCAYFNKVILPKIKKKYIDTNKISYIIREFIGNKQDLDAAILQRCNGKVDSFLKFQSVLLEQQDKWAYSNKYRELLTNIGQLGGVPAETYAKCLNDDHLATVLLANTKLATTSPKFIGTPAFFINGQQVTEGYTFEALSNVIDKALSSNKL